MSGLQIVAVDGRDCRGGNSASLCFREADGRYSGYVFAPIADWVNGVNVCEAKETIRISCWAGDPIPMEESYVGQPNKHTYSLEFEVAVDASQVAKAVYPVPGKSAEVELIRHSQGLTVIERGFDGCWMPFLYDREGARVVPESGQPDPESEDVYYVEFSKNTAEIAAGQIWHMTLQPDENRSGWAELDIVVP